MESVSNSLYFQQFQLAPAIVAQQSVELVDKYLEGVRTVLAKLRNPRIQELFMLLQSER